MICLATHVCPPHCLVIHLKLHEHALHGQGEHSDMLVVLVLADAVAVVEGLPSSVGGRLRDVPRFLVGMSQHSTGTGITDPAMRQGPQSKTHLHFDMLWIARSATKNKNNDKLI